MIVFAQADGSVQSVLPSPVYQGSSLSGGLYLVAPFPAANSVTVSFTLANGEHTTEYTIVPTVELSKSGIALSDVLDSLGNGYSIWEWQANSKFVTQYAGTVTASFKIYYYDSNEELHEQGIEAVNFTVQESAVPNPTEVPSASQWNALIAQFARLNAKVPDKFMTDITVTENAGKDYATIKKTYSDNTVSEETLYVGAVTPIIQSDLVTVVTFTADSWVEKTSTGDEEAQYELVFTPGQTGQSNNKFVAQIEKSGSETYASTNESVAKEREGYYTLPDTVFKGSDGSVLASATEKYAGRLVIVGGNLWNDIQMKATATISGGYGTPTAEVQVKNGDTKTPTFAFSFTNLRGEKGDKGDEGKKGAKGDSVTKAELELVTTAQ